MRLRSALVPLALALSVFAASSARAQGFFDPCLQCGGIYSSDGGGGLWYIDTTTGTSTFVGSHGLTMFDIAATSDGRLVGVDGGGSFWIIDACNASVDPAGFAAGFVNGLTGDLLSAEVFGQGPPLRRFETAAFTSIVVGGSVPGPPPGWCGSSTGDLVMSPVDGMLYSIVFCPSCGSDMLLKVDPATGDALAEVGCLTDAVTGARANGVYGIAFDGECRMFAAQSSGAALLEVDPATGTYLTLPVTGGFNGTFGLASIGCPGVACPGVGPETCEPLTQGFWKRQCRGHHPSGEHEQLPSRLGCVSATATFSGVSSVDEMCARLHPEPENDKCLQAEAQFMALMLNTCSGRLGRSCCVSSAWSSTATTVGEAIAEIDALLSNPGRTFADCVRAQGLADDINTSRALCSSSSSSAPPAIGPRMGGGPAPADPALPRAADRARFRRP